MRRGSGWRGERNARSGYVTWDDSWKGPSVPQAEAFSRSQNVIFPTNGSNFLHPLRITTNFVVR